MENECQFVQFMPNMAVIRSEVRNVGWLLRRKEKTRQGKDRRVVDAGARTNFLTTLDTASNR